MSTPAPATEQEKKQALDNVRKMFRLTMLANYKKPTESIEACRKRLEADPATADVAKKLKCTVAQLLEGFGKDEQFHTAPGYNHAAESARVKEVLENAASAAPAVVEGELAEDKAGKSGTHLGVLKAPAAGERKSAVVTTDEKSAALLKSQMQQVRSMGSGTGMKKKPADDDDELDDKPRKTGAKGKPVPGKR
jgi:hypothetical protein